AARGAFQPSSAKDRRDRHLGRRPHQCSGRVGEMRFPLSPARIGSILRIRRREASYPRGGDERKEVGMLTSKDAMATIAVRDVGIASRFYEGTLGLKRRTTEGS